MGEGGVIIQLRSQAVKCQILIANPQLVAFSSYLLTNSLLPFFSNLPGKKEKIRTLK